MKGSEGSRNVRSGCDDTISRQAAIDALERILDRCEEIEAHLPEGDPDRAGYKMYPDWLKVWNYLRQLPSAEPEPTFEQIKEYCYRRCMTIITNELYYHLTTAYSAQPERIKGHWIKISPANIYECSECGKNVMTDDICAYDFCHGCGANMKGERDERDS